MTRYRIEVGYMVPHVAVLEIDAADETEAQRKAMEMAWETVPEYEAQIENGGPLQTFECEVAT